MKWLRIGLILACVIVPLLVGSAVFAINPPTSDPSVSQLHVNRYLIVEDDALFYGIYDIPYDDLPTVPASDSYIFRLLDGETELGTITPFVLFDNGYRKGVFSFYFDELDDWGEPYTIRISQNPAYFDTPESWDFVIPSSAYTTREARADNQTELTINIIAMAQYLEAYLTEYTLLEDSPGGTILSSPTGENYFRGAIYGIQAMAPDLFLVQVLEIDTTDRTWTTDQFDEYEARFEGTWVEEDTEATASQFGITTQMLMSLIFVLPICLGAIIVSSIKFQKAEPGFVFSVLAMTGAAVMGWFSGAIYATLLQLMAIYLGYVWFYARG